MIRALAESASQSYALGVDKSIPLALTYIDGNDSWRKNVSSLKAKVPSIPMSL